MRGLAIPLALTLVLAGCRSDLDRLERDAAAVRAEREGRRVEDLEAAYAEAKKKADGLSEELLAISRERDRLYDEYDRLHAERAEIQRRIEELRREIEALRGALAGVEEERRALPEED